MSEVTLEVSTYLIEERSGQKGPDLDDDDVFVDADDNDDDGGGGGGQKSATRSVLISTQIKTRTFTKFD